MIVVTKSDLGVSISLTGTLEDQMSECGAMLDTLHKKMEKAIDEKLPEDLLLGAI